MSLVDKNFKEYEFQERFNDDPGSFGSVDYRENIGVVLIVNSFRYAAFYA